MTAQEWQILRSQEELPVTVLFDFYKEKGGTIIDIMQFQRHLYYFYINGKDSDGTTVVVGNGFHIVSYDTMIHKLFNHYNKLFKV